MKICENPSAIALSCSPSRSRNSDSMLDAFIEGAKSEEIYIEKIYLSDIPMDIYTFENRLGPSEHEVQFKELIEKIKCTQGLIIATPTYNFSVPAHLKNFIDRIRCFALDFNHKNKIHQPVGLLTHLKTYFLVSGGTPRWAQILLFFAFPAFWLRAVFLYYASQCYGAFYSGDINTFKNERLLNICRKRGVKFAKKLKKNASHSVLENLFWRPPQHD